MGGRFSRPPNFNWLSDLAYARGSKGTSALIGSDGQSADLCDRQAADHTLQDRKQRLEFLLGFLEVSTRSISGEPRVLIGIALFIEA